MILSRTLTAAVAAATLGLAAPAAAQTPRPFPETIPLPTGFQPEGIAAGTGTTLYVGSIPTGSIYRIDARTGEGEVLVEASGRNAVGIEVDDRGRLWVAGGASGTGSVYDARTGEELAVYDFDGGFVNDVVVTEDAAFFTESTADRQRLYVVPIGPRGVLGEARNLPITGDLQYVAGFNANGIEASPDGETLLVVQSATGKLFRIDADSGVSAEVDLRGEVLTNGDGLLRRGRRLYVVQNRLNRIAVLRLSRDLTSARLRGYITDDDFDVPTTVARLRGRFYAVNARFGTPSPESASFDVVRVP